MGKTEEKKLAERLKNRDRTAMNELYGLYSGYLFALCCRYVTDRDTAKDILHDCFLKIFSSIGRFQFRGEGSLKAWMSRIVINESLKYLKKTAGNDILTSADNLPDIPDEEDGPDVDDIPASVIQEMISRLPDGYRAVFNLFVFEKMSHKEIAGILGIKENSSASQYHRAKALLAKWIENYRTEHHD